MGMHSSIGYLTNFELLASEGSAMSGLSDLKNKGVHTLSVIGQKNGLRLAVGGKLCGEHDKGSELYYKIPVVTAQDLGNAAFRETYRTQYAYYAGSMANGISSDKMVIALGKAGYMGSYGSGGVPLNEVEMAIDRIQAALPDGPFIVNLLHSQNDTEKEEELVSLLLRKSVRVIEASAFINISPALIRYRLAGLTKTKNSDVIAKNRIIAKVSREEVAEAFMSPPNPEIVAALYAQGHITAQQAELAKEIPVADDVTVEADSGGHTDNRPLISLLPLIIEVRDEAQRRFGYKDMIRIGAAGGIGTAVSAAGAFQMGADYVVTGSVNQSCVEADTSDYVKQMLANADMSDVVMAPSADMFESGMRVQVIKKGTMFPMNAQRLYELFTQYGSLDDIPDKDQKVLKTRLFQCDIDSVWDKVKEYFGKVDPDQIRRAEASGKYKMALVFRWYLGNSSRWAINGEQDRKMDMQIWCGKSMGAFNRWVRGTDLESPANRTVVAVADKIMQEAAFIIMKNQLKFTGIGS